MQRANDVTLAAYKAALSTLREGMTQDELTRNIVAGFTRLGSAATSARNSENGPRCPTAARRLSACARATS